MILDGPIERCSLCCHDPVTAGAVVGACVPVAAFGNHRSYTVKVATIGLNPALNEFQDQRGWFERRLRLPIVSDYGTENREQISDNHLKDARVRRESYFEDARRDWHNYFKRLDWLLGRVSWLWSYANGTAVHVDLVACPTRLNWQGLDTEVQATLKSNCQKHFIRTLTELPKQTVLLLNGKLVYDAVCCISNQAECRTQLINVQGQTRWIGCCWIGGRQFEIRGWNLPVGSLKAIHVVDLATWLRGTFNGSTV
jgi:hypothetical protein